MTETVRPIRRRTVWILAALLALAILAGAPAALAGRGGDVTGTIDLMQPNAAQPVSSYDDPAAAWPAYGGWVQFDSTVEGKLAKNSKIFVTVVCWQGDTVVYQSSDSTDAVFNLVDQPALAWDGGEADCTAHLRYKITKGKNTEYTVLDTEEFHSY